MNNFLGGTYIPTESSTISIIEENNKNNNANFILSNTYPTAHAAKMGSLLARLLNTESTDRGNYFSFFANSGVEAFCGAVKLARHTSVLVDRDDGGRVLVIDPARMMERHFRNSAAHGWDIYAGIEFVATPAAAMASFTARSYAAVAIVDAFTYSQESGLSSIRQACEQRDTLFISCMLAELPSLSDLFDVARRLRPDVTVFGEVLAGFQVPFGCFVMTAKAQAVWNNLGDATAHSSTFGGNRNCLDIVLHRLRHAGCVTPADEALFAEIDASSAVAVDYCSRFVNPALASMFKLMNWAMDIDRSAGGRLILRDGRSIIDFAGGAGASLRGHNPADISEDVLQVHRPEHDYFADLERKLADLSGYDNCFPAVSGATAVDIAVRLALAARPGRRKIVVLKGNYSGKTLLSLNLSRTAPAATETIDTAFRPYLDAVVHIDPFAADAEDRLTEALSTGDVALLWCEIVQGYNCAIVPETLFAIAQRLKPAGGYLIGVDEVLTGVWRSRPSFLAQTGVLDADVTALAKSLSDMTLPVAAALAKADVVAAAVRTDPAYVNLARHYYRNGLGAHIALHALDKIVATRDLEENGALQERFRTALETLCRRSRIFGSVEGRGAHVRLTLNSQYFPASLLTPEGKMMQSALSRVMLDVYGVLVTNLRFFYPTFADPKDMNEAIARFENPRNVITPMMVYRFAIGCYIAPQAPWLSGYLRNLGSGRVAKTALQIRGPASKGAQSANDEHGRSTQDALN